MIKVSVFYPNEEGKKFDMEYYLNKHIPMVQQKLGAALKSGAVEQGLGGAEPGSPATYTTHGPSIFRFGRGISNRIWATGSIDYGRYP
jgi:uncharacterized protein (TIGR02118 family)